MDWIKLKKIVFIVLGLFFLLQVIGFFDFTSSIVLSFIVNFYQPYSFETAAITVCVLIAFLVLGKVLVKPSVPTVIEKKAEEKVKSLNTLINPMASKFLVVYFCATFVILVALWFLIVLLKIAFAFQINENEFFGGFSIFFMLLSVFFFDQAFGLTQKYIPDFEPNRRAKK